MRSDDPFYLRLDAWVSDAARCRKCGGRMKLELRPEEPGDGTTYEQRGPFSLSGNQLKISATQVVTGHPWIVCLECGQECRGEYEENPQRG